MKNYLNLSIGAKTRLAILKELNPLDWKKARMATFLNHAQYCGDMAHGFNVRYGKKIPVLYSFSDSDFFRTKFIDEINNSPIGHRGWFCDEDQFEKCRGLIIRLPHGKFLSGYSLSDSGENVYFLDVFTDEREAIFNADRLAENYAEIAREHSEKSHQAQELSEKNEELIDRLRECVALRNNPCFKKLRAECVEIITTIKANKNRLATEFEEVY